MRLSKKIVYSVTATTVNILSGFLRNKIFAIYLSVSLFGILSLAQQGLSILFTLFAFGIPVGISAYAAKLSSISLPERKLAVSKIIGMVFTLSLVVLLLLVLAFLFIPDAISFTVSGNYDFVLPVFIILFACPFMIIQNSLVSTMEGLGLVKELTSFKIVPAVLILPLILFFAQRYHFTGAAVGVFIAEFSFAVFAFIALRKNFSVSKEMLSFFGVAKEVMSFAVASVLVGGVWMIADFVLKRYLLATFGQIDNGIVQSVAKIVDLYPMVVLSWLNLHLFPVLGASRDDKKAVVGHLERTVLISVSLIIPVIFFLFLFREQILSLLYQKDFTIAEDYFATMLVAGIPKVTSWVVGTALLPLGLRKEWLISSQLYIAAYVGLAVIGLHAGFGIYVIPFATILALTFQLFVTLYLLMKRGFQFTRNFVIQIILYGFITVFLFFGKLSFVFLFLAVLVFILIIIRYKLIQDFYLLIHNAIQKATA